MKVLTDIIAKDGTWSDGLRQARQQARLTFRQHDLEDEYEGMCRWLRRPDDSHPDDYTELWERVLAHFSGRFPFELDIAIYLEELCQALDTYSFVVQAGHAHRMSAEFREQLDRLLQTALTIGRCREALRISHLLGQKPDPAELSEALGRGRKMANELKKAAADARVLNQFSQWQCKLRRALAPLSDKKRVAAFVRTLESERDKRRIRALLREGRIPDFGSKGSSEA